MNGTSSALPTLAPVGHPNEMEPRRGSHLFDFAALAVILAGDAVAFYQLAARAMGDASDEVVWALVIALSLAATVSMHYAGAATRARRSREDHPGLTWWGTLILAWLALGGVSVWFRIVAPQPTMTGGFGASVDTSAATHTPVAALLLMLYLVGGLSAYGIGFKMHNPARAAYFRTRSAHRRAERRYRWALWRLDRVDAVPLWQRLWLRLRGRWPGTSKKGTSPTVATSTWTNDDPVTRPTADGEDTEDAGDVQRESHPQVVFEPGATRPVDELAIRRQRSERRARAQAEQLRQVARHRLAVALADPASSTGVFVRADNVSEPRESEGNGS